MNGQECDLDFGLVGSFVDFEGRQQDVIYCRWPDRFVLSLCSSREILDDPTMRPELEQSFKELRTRFEATHPPRAHGTPDSMLLSASWQCPVCNQRGDLHEHNCFVAEAAAKIRQLREANYRLMETNGRLRERPDPLSTDAAPIRCAACHMDLTPTTDQLRALRRFGNPLRRQPCLETKDGLHVIPDAKPSRAANSHPEPK